MPPRTTPLHPAIKAALAPGEVGRLVKGLGALLPGVRDTGRQITEYATHWRSEAETALAGDPSAPLLVGFGDSLTQGVGASHPQLGYVALLQTRRCRELGQPVHVVNLSRSGATIADIIETQLPAFAELPERLGPVWQVCTVGNNDLMGGSRPKTVAQRFDTLLPMLPAHTIVATLPSAGSIGAKLVNRSLRASATAEGLPIADVGEQLRTWRGNTAGDRFHPNDQGYEIWVEAFWSQLNLKTTPNRH